VIHAEDGRLAILYPASVTDEDIEAFVRSLKATRFA
jgi:hypothetical protein